MTRAYHTLAGAALLVAVLLTGGCPRNKPPDEPTVPSGPSSGLAGVAYPFGASADDPNGDSVSLRFDWGDGDTSDWRPATASGGTTTADHSWDSLGTYVVKAQAKDTKGSLSSWSSGHQIALDSNSAPHTPCFVMVATSVHVGSSLSYHISVPDPDNDEVCIRFAWNDGDTSGWSEWFNWSRFEGRSCSSPDTYAVCVQAQDVHGDLSDWAGPCSALSATSGNLPPHTPIPSGPDTVRVGSGDGFYVHVYVDEPEHEDVTYMVDWGNGDTWRFGSMSYYAYATSLVIPYTRPSPGAYTVRLRARDTNLNESFWSTGHRIVVVP